MTNKEWIGLFTAFLNIEGLLELYLYNKSNRYWGGDGRRQVNLDFQEKAHTDPREFINAAFPYESCVENANWVGFSKKWRGVVRDLS